EGPPASEDFCGEHKVDNRDRSAFRCKGDFRAAAHELRLAGTALPAILVALHFRQGSTTADAGLESGHGTGGKGVRRYLPDRSALGGVGGFGFRRPSAF